MPVYELLALPGQTQQSSPWSAFVRHQWDKQTLTAFMTASSDPDDYGQLIRYTIPAGQTGTGLISYRGCRHQQFDLPGDHPLGPAWFPKVVLGSVIMTPIGESLLYIQPMYVEQVQNGVPRLTTVVVVYNNNAYHSGSGSPLSRLALCNVTNGGNNHPFARTAVARRQHDHDDARP